MGRSVAYLTNSMHEVYLDVSDYDENGWQWDDLMINLKSILKRKLPSLRETKEWDGRETLIFLQNCLCEIGISEYAGLASLSIRVRPDIDDNKKSLAENWINSVWSKIESLVADITGEVLVKEGSFSNGEGIFHKKNSKEGFCHNGMGKTYEF